MTRAFRSIGLALTCLVLLGISTVAQAQTPPKDMVALKIVDRTTVDPAVSFTLPMTYPVEYTKYVGTGEGSPLGPSTTVATDRTYLGVDGTELWYEGEGSWTAANGDAIFFTYVGLANPTKAGFIITGGKGRFQGATGSGVFTYTVNADGTEFVDTYEGFISVPKP
jgi:hypothetical protein